MKLHINQYQTQVLLNLLDSTGLSVNSLLYRAFALLKEHLEKEVTKRSNIFLATDELSHVLSELRR